MNRTALCLAAVLLAGCASEQSSAPSSTSETPKTEAAKPAEQPSAQVAPIAPKAPEAPKASAPEAASVTPPEAPKAPAAEAPAAATLSHDNEPKNLYFESQKDGKVYVLAYVSTLMAVQRGPMPAGLDEKANFGPEGETVVFENDVPGVEERLVTEYQKQHPKPAK